MATPFKAHGFEWEAGDRYNHRIFCALIAICKSDAWLYYFTTTT